MRTSYVRLVKAWARSSRRVYEHSHAPLLQQTNNIAAITNHDTHSHPSTHVNPTALSHPSTHFNPTALSITTTLVGRFLPNHLPHRKRQRDSNHPALTPPLKNVELRAPDVLRHPTYVATATFRLISAPAWVYPAAAGLKFRIRDRAACGQERAHHQFSDIVDLTSVVQKTKGDDKSTFSCPWGKVSSSCSQNLETVLVHHNEQLQ